MAVGSRLVVAWLVFHQAAFFDAFLPAPAVSVCTSLKAVVPHTSGRSVSARLRSDLVAGVLVSSKGSAIPEQTLVQWSWGR